MKNFLGNHCYTFLITGIIFIFSLFISLQSNDKDTEQYISIKVNAGDTLWELAEDYQTHNLTKEDFIDWIIENNEIQAGMLKPGDTIVIPVSRNANVNNLASSK